MSKTYNGGQYTFSFQAGGGISPEEISKNFFKKLKSPTTLETLLTDEQYSVYESLLLFKEHVEDDYVYRTIDGVERLDDYDDYYEKGTTIGFASSRFFTADEVQDLYVHVVIPIYVSCDVASKPTGEFCYLHVYTETVGQSHKISFNEN
jgi:hypothetical protein